MVMAADAGAEIRKWRKANRVSQQRLADAVGHSQSWAASVECGRTLVAQADRAALMAATGIDVVDDYDYALLACAEGVRSTLGVIARFGGVADGRLADEMVAALKRTPRGAAAP